MNADTNTTTISLKLSELPLEQLVQLNQGLGHDIERLRDQRKHVKALLAARLAAGDREHAGAGDATAPGAVLEVTSQD